MCSDPGQELIQQDIRENRLNRVVVAACSPLLHEHTFRKATEKGGLNPFFFQMVNIREHNSWVHTDRARSHPQGHGPGRAPPSSACPSTSRSRSKRCPINPDVLDRGRRHRRHPCRADPGQRRQACLSGRARAHHRRPHGQIRQDLPHARLRRVRAFAQDGRGGRASEHHAVDLLRSRPRWTATWATSTSPCKPQAALHLEDLCTGCQECIEACVYQGAEVPPTSSTWPGQAQAGLHSLPAGHPAGRRSSIRKPASS